MASTLLQCAEDEKLYKSAASHTQILQLFGRMTRNARAQFLVGLGPEFRESIAKKYPVLTKICRLTDVYLRSLPGSFERESARHTISKDEFGSLVVEALMKQDPKVMADQK